ncbi:ALK and LTK ligand 2 [Spea bombifrons]|uniref:ALK and LTK ligand 2 n=1 Tax=Spea bombifrons TaxID=233779 RepID=UPI0023493387|nr:ALK and LTK ligand 2 [Spea bombifrons]
MRDLRFPALLALALLMLSSGYCKERTESSTLSDKTLLNFIMKIIKDLKKHNVEEENGVQHMPKEEDYSIDYKDDPDYGFYQEQRVEIVPRDLRMKEKFLKHLTGRLSFTSPNCNKLFRRVYNTTRDCTTPTHYKRCARLLNRLAISPSCMDG